MNLSRGSSTVELKGGQTVEVKREMNEYQGPMRGGHTVKDFGRKGKV